MSNWLQSNGAKLRLVADPDKMNKGAGQGTLEIECTSYALVPLPLIVLRFYSDDPNVATASHVSNSPASFSAPRRPDKRSAATPSRIRVKVGLWSPQNQGDTTVRAQVDVNSGLSVLNPEDDVQVR